MTDNRMRLRNGNRSILIVDQSGQVMVARPFKIWYNGFFNLKRYIMTVKTDTQVALAAARTALALAKVSVKELVQAVKAEKERAVQAKATAKEAKRQASIRKAQATLARLLDKTNPVGAKARKAARRPGPVIVTKG